MTLIRTQFKYSQEIPKLPNGEHSDSNTPGLFLIKRETGRSSWTWLYRFNGKQKRWTLGRLARISLKKAREMVRKSEDPVGDKKRLKIKESKNVTFSQLVDRYIKDYAKVKQRFWRQTKAALRNSRFKSWMRRNINDIERRDVKNLLASIPGNGSANQTKNLLHGLFAYAVDEEIVSVNPVMGIKRRDAPPRDRFLNDDEIRSVWNVPIFRILLLSGQRPTNVKNLLRSELDGNKWTIPASKFKTKKIHVVPLVTTALETLSDLPERGDRFFTSRDCIGLEKVLSDLGVPKARPKDLQRTVRTRLSQYVSPDTAERLQGHALPGMRGVYDQHDYWEQKFAALRRWEIELLRIVNEESGKVLPFGAKIGEL